jgi:1-acyl-sn-glycerol-3-phosphate acyltransferase
MIRSIYWYFHFFFTLLLKTPDMYKYKKWLETLPAEEFDARVEKLAAEWAQSQIKAAGASVSVKGLENIPKNEAVLFVSNHQGNFDIALFLAFIRLPKGYIAKIETLKIPFIGTWMRYIKCLFIDRKDIRQSAQTITEGIQQLKNGYSLVVFPEGTRSKGGPTGEFKSGSFKLATKSKVKIVPVTIDGSYKLMEANGNKIKPATVKMTVHPPVETAALSKEEIAALPETVQNIIESVL